MARSTEILEAINSIEFAFGEFHRKAVRDMFRAKLAGNNTEAKRIDKARKQAIKSKDEAIDLLANELLSDTIIDQMLGELAKSKKEAQKLLKKLQKTQKALDTIEKAADLAVRLVKSFRQIL